jgi:transposase InsO family protein
MTDHGSGSKACDFRDACRGLGLRHIRPTPSTPRTDGKAGRFLPTALRESAHAKACAHSDRRTAELPAGLHLCNRHRPQGSSKAPTPVSRLGLTEDNLLSLHS